MIKIISCFSRYIQNNSCLHRLSLDMQQERWTTDLYKVANHH